MNKFSTFSIVILFFIIPFSSLGWTQKDAQKKIKEADIIVRDYETKYKEYLKHIPHDTYSDAIINIVTAKTLLNKKSYYNAYFLAKIAIIKLNTAAIIAQKRKLNVQYQKIVATYNADQLNKISNLDTKNKSLTTSNKELLKKIELYQLIISSKLSIHGPSIVASYYDEELFSSKLFLGISGIERLQQLYEILKRNPNCFITIAGHSARYDYKNITLKKAIIIKNHLTNLGIKSRRITAIGLGNTEVSPTGKGYRRTNRIEVILNGIIIK